jgi:hypothetical protein
MDVKAFENFSPCVWTPAMRYMYVKEYGKLPNMCYNCWKPLVFFDDKDSLKVFEHKLSSTKPNFHYKLIPKGIVAYAHSVEERERILEVFKKISAENAIRCRIQCRHAGRYWQDMFPELFGKDVNNYKPFYSREFKFRKLADKAKSQEEIEAIEERIFGINTKKNLESLRALRMRADKVLLSGER